MSECKRCGRCCAEVGRTFWKGGDYEEFAELNEWANDGDHEDSGLPCEMLSFGFDSQVQDGKVKVATCLIEALYGRQFKPRVCREYPEEGQLCFREESEVKKCH